MILAAILYNLFTVGTIGASFDFLSGRNFDSGRLLWLLPVILLMAVNWSLEALKWKMLLRPFYPVTFIQSLKATLSGVSFALTTPNRSGDFIGKTLHLPPEFRTKSILSSFYGSYSQWLVTLTMGWAGWLYFGNEIMNNHNLTLIFSAAGFILILFFSFIFFFNKAGMLVPDKWKKYFENSPLPTVKLKIILFSFLRYLVFATQFFLLIRFFGPEPGYITVFLKVTLFYLITSLVPATFWGEIGVKESVAVWVFSGLIYNSLIIVAVTLLLWLINLVFPALLGNYFLLKPIYGERK